MTVLDPQVPARRICAGSAGRIDARELEILQHIVAGKSNKEIAADLNLSANPWPFMRQHHGYAGNSQTAELVVYAIRNAWSHCRDSTGFPVGRLCGRLRLR